MDLLERFLKKYVQTTSDFFMLSRLHIDCATVNNSQATTPTLIWVVAVYMQNAITRGCWAIHDHRSVI